ncbi:MAG: acetylxylan esterase [Pelolinea sp.]|nr:acetylxylan esterase [Pelolinea sp.]
MEKTELDIEKYGLQAVFSPEDFELSYFDTFDVDFSGYTEQTIKGWFISLNK